MEGVTQDRSQKEGETKTNTIDTEIKAKRNNMVSELITFRITKAKAKVKFGVKYLCGHECERSSVQVISIRKRKRNNIIGNYFHFNFLNMNHCSGLSREWVGSNLFVCCLFLEEKGNT